MEQKLGLNRSKQKRFKAKRIEFLRRASRNREKREYKNKRNNEYRKGDYTTNRRMKTTVLELRLINV